MSDDLTAAASWFALDPTRVWLNASHQGPLPRCAADAVAEMVRWKQQPHHLATPAPFAEIPAQLRAALAALLGVGTDEVALANSSSYGLHLVANGLGLGEGDEVIVAANDFPSDVLPWLRLRRDGVGVSQIEPAGEVVTADEVAAVISPATKAVCLTWVHSFSGQVVDLDGIGELCRRNDALFVVNGAQGVGGVPIRLHDHPVDVMTGVGFKYLCGPYGTGFCWLGSRAMERVASSKLYWLSALTTDDLASESLDLDSIEPPASAARHDVFGTANFFNFAALAASVEMVGATGVDAIFAHNQTLAAALEALIDPTLYHLQTRGPMQRRSSILFVRPRHRAVDEVWAQLTDEGIDVARRRGMLRLAPHFYNTLAEIERTAEAMNR